MQSIVQVVSPQLTDTAPDSSEHYAIGEMQTVNFHGQTLPIANAIDILMICMSAEESCAWISSRLADRFVPIPEAN